MNVVDGRMVLSPSDLVSFAACPHLTELERASAAKLVRKPIFSDPAFELLLQRGREHEERYLVELETAVEASPGSAVKGSARRLTRIEVDRTQGLAGVEAAARETEMAMRRGGAIIYQATFFHADGGMSWRGHADFLVRVDAPSDLGDWSYEPADAKLARAAKAGAVLQLCAYAEMVGRLQGRLPEYIRLILGGPGHPEERLRLSDYYAYYRWSKAEFTAAVARGEPQYPPATTYPEPVEKCESCNWSTICDKRRRSDDHLSLVAGITRNQRAALDGMGITTMTGLSRLPIPIEKAPPRASAEALTRVREQARLQVESAAAKTIRYDLLPELTPDLGLGALPAPSTGDLFFDIEGDPFAFDAGIEYLFGIVDAGQSRPYRGAIRLRHLGARRAHGEEGVRRHGGPDHRRPQTRSEPARIPLQPLRADGVRRLMSRYGTREAEVDDLRGLLGHSSVKMTERYAHVAASQAAAYMPLLSGAAPATPAPPSGPPAGPRTLASRN